MEEENLDMGLFDDVGDLDLNLLEELAPFQEQDQEEEEQEAETAEADSDQQEETEENNLSEGEDPEKVAEEEEGAEGVNNDSPELFSSFAEVLAEQGLLPSANLQDKKVASIEDLTALFKEELSNQAKAYIVEKVGEDGYDALEKGVTLAEYQQYSENVNTLDNITEDTLKENGDLAKQIILEDYMAQGLSEAKAKRLLEKTIDLGEDMVLEDAVESLSSLKAIQQKQLEKLAQQREQERLEYQKQQEKIDNDLKNAIYNSEEYIKGLGKVDKNIQDRVYKSIVEPVGKAPNGVAENKLMQHRRENPIDFDVKLYYLYELTKGFSDFSKVIKQSESKATDKLAKVLRNTKFDTSGTPTYVQDSESYDGLLGDELVL